MQSRARKSMNLPVAPGGPSKGPRKSLNQFVMGAPKQPPKAPKGFAPGSMPKAPALQGLGVPANPILSGKKITPTVKSARPGAFKAPMPSVSNQGPALGGPKLARAAAALSTQKSKVNKQLGSAGNTQGLQGATGIADDQDPT